MTVQARNFNPSLPLFNLNRQEILNPTSYMACDSVYPSSDGNAVMRPPETTMINHLLSYDNDAVDIPVSQQVCGDLSMQLMRQQTELDQLISFHTETMKREIEEQRRMQTNKMMGLIREEIAKKLREKDEEIEKMNKLSMVLEERAQSLYLENQSWRQLAQSKEATAKALQSHIEQLSVQVKYNAVRRIDEDGDAESCCGSNWHDKINNGQGNLRMCRMCGGKESSVLVLPCRHLCLCTECEPTIDVCPVCICIKNTCLDVYFS